VDAAAAGLAVIPPTLAILVEFFNPISGNRIGTDAKIDLEPFRTDNHDELVTTVSKSTEAAVEISGLAPTLVSAATSGFAIIHEYPQPFWPAIGYVLVFIAILLFLLWMLSGKTFFNVDDEAFLVHLFWKERRFPRRTRVVKITIYTANVLLIVLALGSYAYLHGQ
jgi:hypothetical protein